MRDSDTYMAIIDEGRKEEAKNMLLLMGRKRFGSPDETIMARVSSITDLDRLHRLAERLFDASSWQELLDTL